MLSSLIKLNLLPQETQDIEQRPLKPGLGDYKRSETDSKLCQYVHFSKKRVFKLSPDPPRGSVTQ